MRLSTALMDALKEKPISSLSVSEVCRRADVNRATFYLHFHDLRHLWSETILDRLDVLTAGFAPSGTGTACLKLAPEQLESIFRHLRENAVLYRPIIDEGGLPPFQPRLLSMMERLGPGGIKKLQRRKKPGGTPSERELAVSGALGVFVGTLVWRLRSGLCRYPEYMADRCAWFLFAGIYSHPSLPPPSIE